MTRRNLAMLPILAMLPMATPCQNGKNLTSCKTCKYLDRSKFVSEETPNHDALCLAPEASVVHRQRDFDWYEGTETITEETVHPLASSINSGDCKYWQPIKKGGN